MADDERPGWDEETTREVAWSEEQSAISQWWETHDYPPPEGYPYHRRRPTHAQLAKHPDHPAPPEPEGPALTLESRCTCTHRYPYHDHGGACTICACLVFALADGPVVRARTGPACDTCGAELLLVRPGRTTCERCRLAGAR